MVIKIYFDSELLGQNLRVTFKIYWRLVEQPNIEKDIQLMS